MFVSRRAQREIFYESDRMSVAGFMGDDIVVAVTRTHPTMDTFKRRIELSEFSPTVSAALAAGEIKVLVGDSIARGNGYCYIASSP